MTQENPIHSKDRYLHHGPYDTRPKGGFHTGLIFYEGFLEDEIVCRMNWAVVFDNKKNHNKMTTFPTPIADMINLYERKLILQGRPYGDEHL